MTDHEAMIESYARSQANQRLGAAINGAARLLPVGWMISIDLSTGCGIARLHDPDGTGVDADKDYGDLAQTVEELTKRALVLHQHDTDTELENVA